MSSVVLEEGETFHILGLKYVNPFPRFYIRYGVQVKEHLEVRKQKFIKKFSDVFDRLFELHDFRHKNTVNPF